MPRTREGDLRQNPRDATDRVGKFGRFPGLQRPASEPVIAPRRPSRTEGFRSAWPGSRTRAPRADDGPGETFPKHMQADTARCTWHRSRELKSGFLPPTVSDSPE